MEQRAGELKKSRSGLETKLTGCFLLRIVREHLAQQEQRVSGSSKSEQLSSSSTLTRFFFSLIEKATPIWSALNRSSIHDIRMNLVDQVRAADFDGRTRNHGTGRGIVFTAGNAVRIALSLLCNELVLIRTLLLISQDTIQRCIYTLRVLRHGKSSILFDSTAASLISRPFPSFSLRNYATSSDLSLSIRSVALILDQFKIGQADSLSSSFRRVENRTPRPGFCPTGRTRRTRSRDGRSQGREGSYSDQELPPQSPGHHPLSLPTRPVS